MLIGRLFSWLLNGLGWSSQADQSTISKERFTAEFVDALADALPGHSVAVSEPLHLTLQAPDGTESSVFLGNAYNTYVGTPQDNSAIIHRYLRSLVEMTGAASSKLDPERIVPVIKDFAWLQETNRLSGRPGLEKGVERVVEDFNGDLVIVYAEDSPTSTRYFSQESLNEVGIERQVLRELAISNLRRLLPPIEVCEGERVSMLTAGEDYVSSLLLIDELWEDGRLSVDGEIVVAVPSRDVILFTGSRDLQGVTEMKVIARNAMAKGPYTLTDQLFVYRNGRFERFAH